MTKQARDWKLRYKAMYFRFVTNAFGAINKRPDATGSSDTLDNLISRSAGKCAVYKYAKCVIVDRKSMAIVKVLKRTSSGITINDPA